MLFTIRARSRSAGFSLGEVLVALVIAAMMAAILTRFVGGTRANAGRIGEAMEMASLGETLLARIAYPEGLKPGRTDGRSGRFLWRIEVVPVRYTTLPRRMASAQAEEASAERQESNAGAGSGFSGFRSMAVDRKFSLGSDEAEEQAPDEIVRETAWVPYRVNIIIEAPSGRRHVSDTIRIGAEQSEPL